MSTLKHCYLCWWIEEASRFTLDGEEIDDFAMAVMKRIFYTLKSKAIYIGLSYYL